MKVNMTPNPLDVVTIHASQGDTEARQWEFELHNNGELIDTSEITEQMVFKSYKGGTEQILPENTSTPTTSPFKGDIRYPQGLLSDQEFLYRECPTEEDGLAKITDIKGNTLAWNQLIEKGNMTDGWTFSNSTGSYSNNILTFTASAQNGFVRPDRPQYIYAGHKYFGTVDVKATSAFTGRIYFTGHNESFILDPNYTTSWKTFSLVFTNTVTEYNYYPRVFGTRNSGWDAVQIRNCMLIDLTQMGLDITDQSDFTSLFPLPYYAYNQGTLLSFNGNGIKTVGKNQCNADDVQVGKAWNNVSNSAIAVLFAPIRPNTQYTISITSLGTTEGVFIVEESGIGIINGVSASLDNSTKSFTFTSKSDSKYLALQCNKTAITKSDFESVKFMLEHGATASSYEPYTSSTLSLPISTYFPNGMKSAGNVYDEWTPTKATTRVGTVEVPISSPYWQVHSSGRFYLSNWMPSNISSNRNANIINNRGLAMRDLMDEYGSYMWFGSQGLYINKISSTETIAQMQTRVSGLKLYYELATPTETSFTTASLVTESAEIPLSNEDGVLIGKCTEQLSAEPGFHDAKIKLADGDGECYSNKIQLHVERSPQ